MPFSASIQHVKNIDQMLQCDECSIWRLLYSKYKLIRKEKADLLKTIEVVSFACGTQIQDLNLPGCLNEVYKRQSATWSLLNACTTQLNKLLFAYTVLLNGESRHF